MQDSSHVLCNDTSYGDLQSYCLTLFDSSSNGDAPYGEPLSSHQTVDDSYYLAYDEGDDDYPNQSWYTNGSTDQDSSNGTWLGDFRSYFAGFWGDSEASSNEGYYSENQWPNYLGFGYGACSTEDYTDQENQDKYRDVSFNTIWGSLEEMCESIFGQLSNPVNDV